MYFLIIILGVVFYYLYYKGIIKIRSDKKSEDTRNHILNKASNKFKRGELSKEEYDKIKKDLKED